VADLPDGGRIEILADQTEVVHLRSQVNRLDTLAELGEMAAGVAHEVRNPMNAVEGFAGLLEKALKTSEDGPLDTERLLRYTDRIRRGVSEVDGIIRNLLLWASPERARHDPVDLPRLLAEVVTEALFPGRVPGAKSVDVSATSDDVHIKGDRLKLKLAFSNLVRNAQEAAGPDGHVRVFCEATAECVEVRVEDNGPGIPLSVRGRIFRPFTTTKPEGTGLGLALTRKFVELHGGRVLAKDSELGGACFVVSLPQVRSGVLA
jgi:signal transduction histidine kinase